MKIYLTDRILKALINVPGHQLSLWDHDDPSPHVLTLSEESIQKIINGDELTFISPDKEYQILRAPRGRAQDNDKTPNVLITSTSVDMATLREETEIILSESIRKNEAVQRRIAESSSRANSIISKLLPQWFSQTFGDSLIDDLFSFAKEEGGKIWWLKLAIVASQFVIKFAWRRFGQRKAAENAGSLPRDRGDDL